MVQTLAREAWMALSLDVSSADVAYRKSLGKALLLPRGSRERGCRLLMEAPRRVWVRDLCFGEDGHCKIRNCSGIDGRENNRQALGPHLI